MIQREKLGWILVVAFLASCVAAYFLLGPKPDHRLEEIKQDVQSNIRAGMTRPDVESFLTQRGIEHSYFSGIDETGNPNMTRSEVGIVRGKPNAIGFRSDVQLVFRFDESEKLKEYSVKEVVTGL
jgi:hypothetical protein